MALLYSQFTAGVDANKKAAWGAESARRCRVPGVLPTAAATKEKTVQQQGCTCP